MKEKLIKIIESRIRSEFSKHKDLDWPKIAAHKIFIEISNELLNEYSLFLEKEGYMDIDWRAEEPYAIGKFLKTNK